MWKSRANRPSSFVAVAVDMHSSTRCSCSGVRVDLILASYIVALVLFLAVNSRRSCIAASAAEDESMVDDRLFCGRLATLRNSANVSRDLGKVETQCCELDHGKRRTENAVGDRELLGNL